jgi:hypothetical protein
MVRSFLGPSGEVVQVCENDVRKIVENVSHGPLDRSTEFFDSKRHDTIRKSTPWGSKCNVVLICWVNLDLIVAR